MASTEASTNGEKITLLLEKCKLENLDFPNYLKELLQFTGYDNLHSISMMTDDDIVSMEKFAKDELPELLEEEEKIRFYGIYKKKISAFKILDGHRKLLKMFINECRKRESSSESSVPCKKRKLSDNESCNCKGKRKHHDKNGETANEGEQDLLPLSEEQQQKAIDHIRNIVVTYVTKFLNSLKDENERNKGMTNLPKLEIRLNKNTAIIKCCECSFLSKTFTRVEHGKPRWVLSNFNKHYKTHFKKYSVCENSKESSSKHLKDSSILSFFKGSVVAVSDNGSCTLSNDINSPGTSSDLTTDVVLIPESDTVLTSLDFSKGRVTTEAGESNGNPAEETVLLKQHVTPSRRLKIKNNCTLDIAQSKITDFFQICETIKQKINENVLVLAEFEANLKNVSDIESPSKENSIQFFEMLKNCVERNSKEKSKVRNRYPDQLKKLSLYLFLTAGRLAYETLVANMNSSLPSITTLYRTLGTFPKTGEGEIKISELKEFLLKRDYPLKVFISEDQTAIIERVRYNYITNQMVGFVCQISDSTGFPKLNQFTVQSVSDIKTAFENQDISSTAYVYMVQPLVDHAPAFCVCIFGSNNRFTAETVLKRWKYLETKLAEVGISVEGFSADGDTRCLKAMKLRAGLPSKSETSPYAPYFKASYLLTNPIVVQDTIHISTKIKTRILNTGVTLSMGNYLVSEKHLEYIIEHFPKSQHFLTRSFLEASDKMNFEAINKMSAPCVTNLLEKVEGAEATKQILILTRYVLDAFIDKSLEVSKRVYLIWYATFFLRLWRGWVQKHEHYTLSKNWLTLNTYTCIEINAHAMILMIDKCRSENTEEIFLPWLFSSQPCERFFRQTRSMTSTYSTIVNFDLMDILNRSLRIQCINDIISDSGDQFIFPREKNAKMGINIQTNVNLPSVVEIKGILDEAKKNALADAGKLGMQLEEDCEFLEKVDLRTSTETPLGFPDEETHATEETEAMNSVVDVRVDVNPEDLEDIRDEMKIFKRMTEFDLKDYSQRNLSTKNGHSPFLQIKVNEKILTVKKSTLCWLVSTKIGRLSSDRVNRVKGMNLGINTAKRNGKSDKKKNNDAEGTSSSEGECSYTSKSDSEFEFENETELDHAAFEHVELELEKYYAIYYDNRYYIGRILNIFENSTCKIKFLKAELDSFIWPKEEDSDVVENKFIFYGPIELLGSGPFQLRRFQKLGIENRYKLMKKSLKLI